METIFQWIVLNKEWVLSGIGIALLGIISKILKKTFNAKSSRKLKINFTFKQAWVQTVIGQGPVFPLYSFEIINIGTEDIQIKDIQIYFCGEKINTPYGVTDGLTQIDQNNPKKYQVLLSPKRVLSGDFEISSFLPMINNQLTPNTNIRLRVIDTLNNKYYSKKTKYKNFLESVNISNTVNSKR